MLLEQTYFFAALVIALICTWIVFFALSLKLLFAQQKSSALSLLLAIILGPLIPFWHFFKHRSKLASKSILLNLIAIVIVVCTVIIPSYVTSRSLKIIGEELQSYIAMYIIIGSFLAGYSLSARSKKIAFIEGLFLTAFFACLYVPFVPYLMDLFTFGAATAYFALILIVSLVLFLLFFTIGGSFGYMFSPKKLKQSGYEFFMAKRLLMAKRSNKAVSLITIISIFAITIGCASMIVVMSVMNGFSSDLTSKILGSNAHVVLLKFSSSFENYPKVIDKTKNLEGVVGVSPFIVNEVMLSSDINFTGAVIKGIETKSINSVSMLGENISKGKLNYLDHPQSIPAIKPKLQHDKDLSQLDDLQDAFDLAAQGQDSNKTAKNTLPAIIIGSEMAKALKITIGDSVNVISPIGELGPSGPVPKAKAFRVGAIFYSGMYEYDSKFVYIALSQAQSFFDMKASVSGIEYKLDNIDKTTAISHQLTASLSGYPYYSKTWMEMNKNLFSALKLEKIAMFIILAAMIFMASLLILVTLILVVIEKGKEIAILKSMGAANPSIMKIFVSYGVMIGSCGAILGLILGVILCLIVKFFGIGLDPQIYYITHLPIEINLIEISIVTISAIIISFLATIAPALFAAKLNPVDGLRYD